jgi:regulator of protease activity HflC (stomatin/prohibitin superfamily)
MKYKNYINPERDTIMRSIKSLVVIIIAGLLVVTALLGSWYTVDQGERAVILRNGLIVGVSEPGLGWKIPVIDKVRKMSVQSRIASYSDMATYSRDQQLATLSISVNYHLNAGAIAEIYSAYGSEEAMRERLISPRVLAESKNVFGRFNAVEAIQQRERLNAEVLLSIQETVQGPISIESIQIENIDFSKTYEDSIEQRMLAEVEVQKVRQNLERERVQAEILITQATAETDATKLRGDAEAYAINAKGEALRNNPGLVDLVQAEKWNGVLPTTMLPSQTLPIIGVNPL